MNILDWITDLVVTAWELLGLILLTSSADPILLRRWESDLEAPEVDNEHDPSSARRLQEMRQAHFA